VAGGLADRGFELAFLISAGVALLAAACGALIPVPRDVDAPVPRVVA
jgi:hypothetical protein